jgi:hypothetical protein
MATVGPFVCPIRLPHPSESAVPASHFCAAGDAVGYFITSPVVAFTNAR